MKLLFDQNLSWRLVQSVAEQFPGSSHVRLVGLESSVDTEIWDYAAANGFAVVSKDSDFRDTALRFGPPPKAIHLDIGKSSTDDVLALLRSEAPSIREFAETDDALLVISRAAIG